MALRLQTYNVHLFPPWLCWLSGLVSRRVMEKDDAQRLRGIAAALRQTDADLVLLTELWHPSHAAALRALLGDRWPHAVQPSASGAARARPLGSGLLLLSKRPIVSSAFVRFAQSAGVDRLACKGMLCARIALDAGEFSLIGTHLQANYVDADHQIACDAQIAQLLAAAQQRRADAVLGDFNQAPDSSGFRRLAAGLAALGLHCEVQGAARASTLQISALPRSDQAVASTGALHIPSGTAQGAVDQASAGQIQGGTSSAVQTQDAAPNQSRALEGQRAAQNQGAAPSATLDQSRALEGQRAAQSQGAAPSAAQSQGAAPSAVPDQSRALKGQRAERVPSLHRLFWLNEPFVQLDYVFAKGLRWALLLPSADSAFASSYCCGDEDLSDHFPLLVEVQL